MQTTEADAVRPPAPDLFGHPRALGFLAGTEFWDRVSFHAMQALLVLYMVDQLLLPGHVEQVAGFPALRATIEAVTGPLSTQALASQIFGLYIGLASSRRSWAGPWATGSSGARAPWRSARS